MKRDKYDTVISDLIRERAHWTCEKCGLISPEGQARGKDRSMQASHFNKRGTGNIPRYDTDAISCHCASCHSYLEDRPAEHTAWFTKRYGERLLEIITEKHNRLCKMSKEDKESMYNHYKSELAYVRARREDGQQGYIETVSYF